MIYYNIQSKRTNPLQLVYDKVNKQPKKVLTFPAFVDIELTNHCNLNCKMCPRFMAERKQGFMALNTFVKVANECKKYDTPIRLIGWGEPLLHPAINDVIKDIKQNKIPLHITTNGILLKDRIVRTIVDLKVDSLIVSFQGTNAKQYQEMRRQDKYNEIKNNIQYLVKARGEKEKPFIQVTTTTTTETEEEKKQFINEWLPLVDAVSVGKTNMSFFEPPQAKQYVSCTEVNHQIQVDWDGNISPCCGDYDNFLTIGNIKETSINELWNKSKKLECIRELLKNKNHKMFTLCRNCYPTYDEID